MLLIWSIYYIYILFFYLFTISFLYIFLFREFISANYNNTLLFSVNIPFDMPKNYILLPYGLIYKIISKKEILHLSYIEDGLKNLPTFLIPQKYTIDSWDKLLVDQYWSFYEVYIRYIINENELSKNEKALKYGLKAVEKKITGEVRPKNDLSYDFYYLEVLLSSLEKLTDDPTTKNV